MKSLLIICLCLSCLIGLAQEEKYCQKIDFSPSKKLDDQMDHEFYFVRSVILMQINPQMFIENEVDSVLKIYGSGLKTSHRIFIKLKSGLEFDIYEYSPPTKAKNMDCNHAFRDRQKFLEFCKEWSKKDKVPNEMVDEFYASTVFYKSNDPIYKVKYNFVYNDKLRIRLVDKNFIDYTKPPD